VYAVNHSHRPLVDNDGREPVDDLGQRGYMVGVHLDLTGRVPHRHLGDTYIVYGRSRQYSKRLRSLIYLQQGGFHRT
jgi:hypothetical protein